MQRKKFIGVSAAAGTALLFSALDSFSSNHPVKSMGDKKLVLKVMATSWGFEGTNDAYCKKVKEEGYDGIEMWWPMEKKEQDEWFALLKQYQLEVGFLCGRGETDYREHLEQFKAMTDAAALQNTQRPLYINCHSGRDHFSFEQNKALIEHTTALTKKTGIIICHETHRSRMLFAAHITRQFIEKIADLRITLDISHWCNVHESLLHDQEEAVALALSRAEHIHARIGHPEGPQVNDPRAPEWEEAVNAHLAWWDKIVERKKNAGEPVTVLTEFGPPDYMPTLPYSRKPLADQWEINVHMMKLLRKRYLQ